LQAVAKLRQFVVEMYRSWCSHRGGALAAELLLFGVLSALPLLLTLAALLGSLESLIGASAATQFQDWVLSQVGSVVGGESQVVDVVAGLFESSARKTVTVGLVIAVYSASRAFISMVGSLDVVYGTTQTRSWVGQRMTGIGLTVLALIVVPMVLVALYGGGRIAEGLVEGVIARRAVELGVGLAGYVLAVLGVAALYKWAPKRSASWSSQLPGAVVVLLLIAAWTSVFRWYVGGLGSNAVFGTIGAAISLLWWGYFCASSFFFGAELNEWFRTRRGVSVERDEK
jgi:membrane protein